MKKTFLIYLSIISILMVFFFIPIPRTDFYKNTRVGDLARIPLIDPYEIGSATGSTWFITVDHPINFIGIDLRDYGLFIDSVGVGNDFFVLHSPSVQRVEFKGVSAWLVFDCKSNVGQVFYDKRGYLTYIKRSYKINNLKLYDPNLVYKKFEKTLELPREWKRPYPIPNCP